MRKGRMVIRAGLLLGFGFVFSCERFEPAAEVVLRTESVQELAGGGFEVTGRIINIGDNPVTQHGFCWSELHTPTIGDATSKLGSRDSEGTFSTTITDYGRDMNYSVRAYITTEEGTSYGRVLTFTTPPPDLPEVTTFPVSGITENYAVSGGEVIYDGGSEVFERGICWNTEPEPSIIHPRTVDGSGAGAFTSTMNGLNCSSTFYIRAYATNAVGTGYGNEVTFTTSGCIPQEGAFILSDRGGTYLMFHTGELYLFNGYASRDVGVSESRVYLHYGQKVDVFDLDGMPIRTITIDSRVNYPYKMCVLNRENFAFLDNQADKVSFTNSSGALLREISLTGDARPGPDLQSVFGVVVENSLIISEDGKRQLIRFNLDTYERSVFRDFSHLSGWLGDIDYSDGTYYLCQSMKVYSFREGEEERLICQLPEGNNTGIAVLGDFAYVTSNFGNKVYRINVHNGSYDVLTDVLDYPQDIELIN